MLNERITVAHAKKEVYIQSYGSAPYAETAKGQLIPNGFCVRTYVSGVVLIASTQVVENKVSYQFTSEDGKTKSNWTRTPSKAMNEVQALLKNDRHNKLLSGALMIGVTYPSIQQRIREVTGMAATETSQATTPVVSRKRARAATATPEETEVKRAELEEIEAALQFDVDETDGADSTLFEEKQEEEVDWSRKLLFDDEEDVADLEWAENLVLFDEL
jgi:hypothetical protein